MLKCPKCGNPHLDGCYGGGGHYLCMECGWQTEGCDHPKNKSHLFLLMKNKVTFIRARLSYITFSRL